MSFSDAQQFLLQTHKGEKHMTNREMMEIAMGSLRKIWDAAWKISRRTKMLLFP